MPTSFIFLFCCWMYYLTWVTLVFYIFFFFIKFTAVVTSIVSNIASVDMTELQQAEETTNAISNILIAYETQLNNVEVAEGEPFDVSEENIAVQVLSHWSPNPVICKAHCRIHPFTVGKGLSECLSVTRFCTITSLQLWHDCLEEWSAQRDRTPNWYITRNSLLPTYILISFGFHQFTGFCFQKTFKDLSWR